MDESPDLNAPKTDETALADHLANYDIDESLDALFSQIEEQFQQLEIVYQSLINARRYLNANT